MSTPTPRHINQDLLFAERLVRKLRHQYRETYELAYSARKGDSSGGGHGHSDPTGSTAADREAVVTKVKASAKAIGAAVKALQLADSELRFAENRVDPVPLERHREEKEVCRQCDDEEIKANGLCTACYEYERRTGNPRPWHVIERDRQRSKGRSA